MPQNNRRLPGEQQKFIAEVRREFIERFGDLLTKRTVAGATWGPVAKMEKATLENYSEGGRGRDAPMHCIEIPAFTQDQGQILPQSILGGSLERPAGGGDQIPCSGMIEAWWWRRAAFSLQVRTVRIKSTYLRSYEVYVSYMWGGRLTWRQFAIPLLGH